MTILFCGGEDIDAFNNGGSVATTSSFRRTTHSRCVYQLIVTTANWDITHSSTSDYYVSFRYYTTSVGSPEQNLVQFGNSDLSQHISIRSNSTALTVKVWDGSAYVQLGTATAISPTTLYKMCIYIKHGASGVVKLWVNDELVINYSGNLSSYITGAFSLTRLRAGTGSGQSGNYSEVIVADHDISGCSLVTLAPGGNSSDTGFTGSYTDIDEVTNSDADYIYSDAAAEQSNFTLSDLPAGNEYVHGVCCAARAIKGETGPQKFRFYVTLDSTRYYSDYITPTGTWTSYRYIWTKRPDNNAYWSRNDVDALTIGVESSDSI